MQQQYYIVFAWLAIQLGYYLQLNFILMHIKSVICQVGTYIIAGGFFPAAAGPPSGLKAQLYILMQIQNTKYAMVRRETYIPGCLLILILLFFSYEK